MSEENVEIVRRMLGAWTAGRFDEALGCFDPHIVWDDRIRPDGIVTYGTDEMQEHLRIWLGTWTDYSHSFDEYIDAGAHVLVIGRERGRAKGSGIEVDRPTVVLYTIRERLIVSAKNYKSPEAALEAAGLSE